MATNTRTARKSGIRRASLKARRAMQSLDRDQLADLERIYSTARRDIEREIRGYADGAGMLQLEVLQELMGQVDSRLSQLATARDEVLAKGLVQAADLGVQPWAGDALRISQDLTRVADDAVWFVQRFVAEDGLQLSDRIWRINQRTTEVLRGSIEQAVLQGHSASRAARELLLRGEVIPKDTQSQMDAARADSVANGAGQALMATQGNPYDQARRLMRTEINRAHGEAYMAGGEGTEGFAGWRFLLSPRHPEHDICDLHASANLHGLGPGVYPSRERCPWPAHPNTLSFVEIVFEDEVSEADRAGAEDRLEWLARQTPARQAAVLGGWHKQKALELGYLRENEIATPWKVLKVKYERRGIEPSKWALPKTPPPALTDDAARAQHWAPAWDGAPQEIRDIIDRFPPPRYIAPDSEHGAYHLQGGVMMGRRLDPGTPDGRRSWRHEYGHYIDHQHRGPGARYASDSPAGREAVKTDDKLWRTRRREAYKRMVGSSEALADRFRGRRFSESAYQQARYLAFAEKSHPLLDELRRLHPEADGSSALRDRLVARLDRLFQERADIWGQVWARGTPAWKKSVGSDYWAASEYDDIGFIADNFPNGHESYLNIMDLVGSITLNKSGRGHSLRYYKAWRHRQAAEAFANIFDLMAYGRGGLEEELLELLAPAFTRFVQETLL